jgi:hypothetical protein
MSTYGHDPYYAAAVGTSMAAPNVTGSLLLLQQHYQDTHASFMRAATLKALAIHTADESGAADGPDYQYGWGLLNTRSAAQIITEDGGLDHQIIESTLADSAANTVLINVSDPNAIVKATLVWTDPPGTPVVPTLDPTDSMLVNDLDLRVSIGGSTHLPWVLNPALPADAAITGDNVRDNVEQVIVEAGGAGSYSIEVSHKGNLLGNTAQDYALIISVLPPAPVSSGLLIDEDFSGGLPAGWTVQTTRGEPWTMQTPVPAHPRYGNRTGGSGNFAMVDNDFQYTLTNLLTSTLDLSSATIAILRFNSFFLFTDLETINVDVSTNGGSSWSTAWTESYFTNPPNLYTVDLTAAVAGQANVILRFRFQSRNIFMYDGDFWQIDNVQLETYGIAGPPPVLELPGQAENPDPANGSTEFDINGMLSWLAAPLADSYDVYFGTSSTFEGVSEINQAGSSFDPGTLSNDTTYYWRVDGVNVGGTTPGTPWSFTTESPPGGCG